MSWYTASRRLLRLLPRDDRSRLEPELATVLEDTEFGQGVQIRDAASIGSLVVHRWAVAGLRNIGLIASSLLGLAAALALVYVAFAAHQLNGWIDTSLPCEPSVITDPETIIDPAGYHLFSDREVSASEAYRACSTQARGLLAADGITNRATLLYWPLLVVINVLAAAGILIALSYRTWAAKSTSSVRLMAGFGVAALALQGVYGQTIRVVTILVE